MSGARGSELSRRVVKVMGLFSGLQMVGIVCSVIKMKLVALWLHATGVGLFGIYQSVIDTVATFTDMGLRQSAVRDVATGSASPSHLARIALVVRRWSLLAGVLGAVVMAALSPALGRWFFHSPNGAWGFLALSAAMLLNALTGGEQALLQGSRRLGALARSNLWGTVAGLALSVPLFRWCGAWGVVLSIVAYALTMFVTARLWRLRTPRPKHALGLGEVWREGRGFARLGLCMALAAFITSTAHTVFILILNNISSIREVGLVQAGDTVVVRYIGLVFTAIGMEFYPRLAANVRRPGRVQLFVNHEALLLLLILTPVLLLFLLLRAPVVQLLYTRQFMVIIPFISWAALSSIPKAVSWCMAFTIVARGDGFVYILTEGLDALISVPLCLWAYTSWGLTGLGVAYIVWYILYALIAGIVYYRRYRMRLSGGVVRLSLISLTVCALFVLCVDRLPLYFTIPIAVAVAVPYLLPLRRLLKR